MEWHTAYVVIDRKLWSIRTGKVRDVTLLTGGANIRNRGCSRGLELLICSLFRFVP